VQAQSTKETWANQVENGEIQNFSLSYVSLEPAPVESIDKHFQMPHGNNTNYMVFSKFGILSYSLPNQSTS